MVRMKRWNIPSNNRVICYLMISDGLTHGENEEMEHSK